MSVFVSNKGDLILLFKPPGANHWELRCIGRKRHYRKDGSCMHTEALLARMDDWHRARVRIERNDRAEAHKEEA